MKPQDLRDLDLDRFVLHLTRALHTVSGGSVSLPPAAFCALHAHYTELRRWSRRLALIGSGTLRDVLERHYAESLLALPLLPPRKRPGSGTPPVLVDVGSGAGFPGWVLTATRPDLAAFLVEARGRKCAFLEAATRRAVAALAASETTASGTASSPGGRPSPSLPIECLNARVGIPLPEALPATIDVVTVRALKLDPGVLAAFACRLSRQGRILLWLGAETARLPPELRVRRELSVGGSRRRRVQELVPAT